MQVVNRGNKEIICIQDEDAPNSIIALIDAVGWVTIGHVGDDNLILDADDWPAFVKFVNQIESYLNENGLPYSKSDQIPEKCDESL